MRKRFLSITVVVLLLAMVCGIARHDNDRKDDETMKMAEMCLKKIWVASDYTGGYYNGISFCFWKVEDGKCQGGIFAGGDMSNKGMFSNGRGRSGREQGNYFFRDCPRQHRRMPLYGSSGQNREYDSHVPE